MTDLGYEFDSFYVCRHCGLAQFDAVRDSIVCTAVADVPFIVESQS